MTMENLGWVYRSLGAISTSIEFLEMAVDKANRILGHEHPNTLWMTFHLAVSYQHDGRLGDAIKLHENKFETRKRILGDEHPDTKRTAARIEEPYQSQREGTSR
jgi:hypothetical protein